MMLVNSFAFGSPSNLLLTFSGANNSNFFVDSSSSNHTMVTVGTPIQFDGKGVFDGGGYIYTDTLPAFTTHDFLITGKLTLTAWPTGFYAPAIFGYDDPVTVQPISLQIGASGYGSLYKKLMLAVYTGTNTENLIWHETDIALDVEHTFKIQRDSGVIRLFLDDVEATANIPIGIGSLIDNATRFCVGKGGSTLALYGGKVDELNVALTT